MGFSTNSFGKIWGLENKGKYTVVDMSVSKKNKDTNKYETTFKEKFVRFIGTAHTEAANLKVGDSIKIGSCDVTNNYDKEKKITYTNFCVFSFELQGDNKASTPPANTANAEGFYPIDESIEDEDLPF